MAEHLAMKLTQLVKIFREGKWATDFQWWNSNTFNSIFNPQYGYQEGKPLFDDIVQGILNLNPDMLSSYEVKKSIIFDFLVDQTINYKEPQHLHNQSLIDEAKRLINKLKEFQAWQDVDIPITNLWNEGDPVEFGHVTFIAITEEELKKWKGGKFMWSDKAPDVRVLARVKAPGDPVKAIEYTENQVDLVLDILRAFCFPFGRNSDAWKIGVVGAIISSDYTPFIINQKKIVTKLGSGIVQADLRRNLLSELSESQLRQIIKLILKKSPTKLENKLLASIHWLAESTKPDKDDAKFAKICFALETLLGSEAEAEELKSRGITALLAERAAFVGGKDFDDRFKIDRQIRKYYKMRGGIVHGGTGDVTLDDIDKFGELTRSLVYSLLARVDELGAAFQNVDDLEEWVKRQKYTLPIEPSSTNQQS